MRCHTTGAGRTLGLELGQLDGDFVYGSTGRIANQLSTLEHIDALAPTFGAGKSRTNAAKVAAYAPTPVWVGGIFQIIPGLGSAIALVGALYALYLLYLGLMRVMKSSQDKAVGYTVVVVLIAIVVGFVASYITTTFIGIGPMMRIGY